MFSVKVGDKYYTIEFSYFKLKAKDILNYPHDWDTLDRNLCKALIFKGRKKDGIVVGEGDSVCNPYFDIFCKSSGRKIALSKALQSFTSDKDIRKSIWKAYFHITDPLNRAKISV
jgi:hypothetical protein